MLENASVKVDCEIGLLSLLLSDINVASYVIRLIQLCVLLFVVL